MQFIGNRELDTLRFGGIVLLLVGALLGVSGFLQPEMWGLSVPGQIDRETFWMLGIISMFGGLALLIIYGLVCDVRDSVYENIAAALVEE